VEPREQTEAAFVGYLEKLGDPENRNGRAALAALRRGMGRRPAETPEMYPYLVPWTTGLGGWREECFYLVASLFASHPLAWHGEEARNFGGSMALLRAQGGGDSVQRRFVALLSSHRDDLPEHLRHAVSLCASSQVRVNWARLLRDLPYWDDTQGRVQLNWAREFWRRDAEPVPSA
jgi:CRISPR system Cascade subunit CasB